MRPVFNRRHWILFLGAALGGLTIIWSGTAADGPVRNDEPPVARHPERLELEPPEGVTLYGGADIESRVDRRGVVFVAATGETADGFGAVMWKQVPSGKGWESESINLGGVFPGGRGSLSVEGDGRLYLTHWGKESQCYRVRVPGWTP